MQESSGDRTKGHRKTEGVALQLIWVVRTERHRRPLVFPFGLGLREKNTPFFSGVKLGNAWRPHQRPNNLHYSSNHVTPICHENRPLPRPKSILLSIKCSKAPTIRVDQPMWLLGSMDRSIGHQAARRDSHRCSREYFNNNPPDTTDPNTRTHTRTHAAPRHRQASSSRSREGDKMMANQRLSRLRDHLEGTGGGIAQVRRWWLASRGLWWGQSTSARDTHHHVGVVGLMGGGWRRVRSVGFGGTGWWCVKRRAGLVVDGSISRRGR
jgi:hypothetical protein